MSAIPDEIRQAVMDRDNRRCVVCRIGVATDIHHRQRRREGGHSLANCVAMDRVCHGRVHNQPKWARDNGWIVSVYDDPSGVPMRWQGALMYLGYDGSVNPTLGEGREQVT